mmetsp:Transcript_33194/g.65738  ORF Transcript_33194/g.65738 Transcript_33194/m.65738 type:complete len:87 (+) Transcript_33194:422-682(+)
MISSVKNSAYIECTKTNRFYIISGLKTLTGEDPVHYSAGHQRKEKFGDTQLIATHEQNSGKSGTQQQPKLAYARQGNGQRLLPRAR